MTRQIHLKLLALRRAWPWRIGLIRAGLVQAGAMQATEAKAASTETRLIKLLVSGIILLAFSAGATTPTTTVGSSASLAISPSLSGSAPQRIISLMPAFTEAVCMLRACERLIATDRYSDWPASVKKLPKLGSLDDTSLEALIKLKPDLIVAHPGGRLNERLKALGQPLLELRSDTLHDVQHALFEIERHLKTKSEPSAAKLWESAQERIQTEAKLLSLDKQTRVYIEVDSALYAAGPKSYLGELLTALGGQNIVPNTLGAFPKLAPEFVLAEQPDVMMQLHSEASVAKRPGWHAMRAVQQGRVCQWGEESLKILVRPGPRIAEASALMAACLQKTKRVP
jgi:iron complex transport system substrate-binding protein